MVDNAKNYRGRAAVLRGPYGEGYAIENRTTRIDVGSLDVLVHLQVSGVCSGDLHMRDGGFPAPQQPLRPLVGGHEGVGEVVRLGSDVEKVTGIKIGDIVGLGWRNSACGICRECLEGVENSCPNKVVNGLHTDGTFQGMLEAVRAIIDSPSKEALMSILDQISKADIYDLQSISSRPRSTSFLFPKALTPS